MFLSEFSIYENYTYMYHFEKAKTQGDQKKAKKKRLFSLPQTVVLYKYGGQVKFLMPGGASCRRHVLN